MCGLETGSESDYVPNSSLPGYCEVYRPKETHEILNNLQQTQILEISILYSGLSRTSYDPAKSFCFYDLKVVKLTIPYVCDYHEQFTLVWEASQEKICSYLDIGKIALTHPPCCLGYLQGNLLKQVQFFNSASNALDWG